MHPLDGIAFQRFWESRAFELGGGDYHAPGQRVGDFLEAASVSTRVRQRAAVVQARRAPDRSGAARPQQPARRTRIEAIREALPAFERQIAGFAMADAVLTGVETRTSSPLRITRGRTCRASTCAACIPAGEGAGYAGGIMSAAVDGIEVAEAVARVLLERAPTQPAVDANRLILATPVRR